MNAAAVNQSLKNPVRNALQSLGLSVLEPVGRLGSFGVTERKKPIGFRFPHHVYERAHRLLNSMLAVVCTHPTDKFLWTSLEGRTIIREILEERIPQWTTGYDWTTTCSTLLLDAKPCWAANDSHRFNWLGKGDRIFCTYPSPATSC